MLLKISEVIIYCFIVLFILAIISSPRLFYGKIEPPKPD